MAIQSPPQDKDTTATPLPNASPNAFIDAAIHTSKEELLKASSQKKKVGFIHLGCPKNLVDTENMLGILEKEGHEIVATEEEADVMLVNTCAFIEKAQEESVRSLANLAAQGKQLMITGCLAQKFQGELLELFPEAGAVVGI
ncbi:MAG: hypothetical protein K2X66_03960, partial [Cyanobacteria bacterium]|nr:hypothetical protein [Cyanobacteriota bacterium]